MPPPHPQPPRSRVSRTQRQSSHWIHTPAGSPSRSPAVSDDPPTYYTDPALDTFGFPAPVVQFLRDAAHTNARALCIIDATRNCELDCWLARFCDAGLSVVEASRLETLLFEALPHEWRVALTASPSRRPDSPTMSVGTSESSVTVSEPPSGDSDSD